MARRKKATAAVARRRRPRPARRRPGKPEITISKRTKAVRVSQQRLRRLIEFVCDAEDRPIAAVDLAVVDQAEMRTLAGRYLGQAGVTDVLSFDLSDRRRPSTRARQPIFAQIVACGDLAAREARLRRHSARRELMLYVVHGLLHLMGYKHATGRGAARMHAREDQLLTEFGEGPAYGQ